MRRINIIQLLPTKHQKKILKEMMILSSCVYNTANYIVCSQIINHEKLYGDFDLKRSLQQTDNYQNCSISDSFHRNHPYQLLWRANGARDEQSRAKQNRAERSEGEVAQASSLFHIHYNPFSQYRL